MNADVAIIGLHHVNLSVSDLERSAEWYVRVLGLKHGWDMPDVEGRGQKIVLLLPEGAFRLVLTRHGASHGEEFSEFRTGLDHLAFTVRDRAALDSWAERLAANGVAHSRIKEGATGFLITLRDPDNIQLEIYSSEK